MSDDLNPLTKWPDILANPNVQIVSRSGETWDHGHPVKRTMIVVVRIESRAKPTPLAMLKQDHRDDPSIAWEEE